MESSFNGDILDIAADVVCTIPVMLPHGKTCRLCGACCIAPSISSPVPGMPGGKPAGVRCPHLTAGHRCAIYGSPERPAVCGDLTPTPEWCGSSFDDALRLLETLEQDTAPR